MAFGTYANRKFSSVREPLNWKIWEDVGADSLTAAHGGWGSGTFAASGVSANNNTKTHVLQCEIQLPTEYVYAGGVDTANAGESASDADFDIVIWADLDGAAATSATIDAEAYESDLDGTVGSDLVTTAAQNLGTSAAAFSFTVDASGVAQNATINIVIRAVVNDTGGTGSCAFNWYASYLTINARR
jgi:hypothetical protein